MFLLNLYSYDKLENIVNFTQKLQQRPYSVKEIIIIIICMLILLTIYFYIAPLKLSSRSALHKNTDIKTVKLNPKTNKKRSGVAQIFSRCSLGKGFIKTPTKISPRHLNNVKI